MFYKTVVVVFTCNCLSKRNLSLLMPKHQSREIRNISDIFGLSVGMRQWLGRLKEVQSRTNCVSRVGE